MINDSCARHSYMNTSTKYHKTKLFDTCKVIAGCSSRYQPSYKGLNRINISPVSRVDVVQFEVLIVATENKHLSVMNPQGIVSTCRQCEGDQVSQEVTGEVSFALM